MNIALYGTLKFSKILLLETMDEMKIKCIVNDGVTINKLGDIPIVTEKEFVSGYHEVCDSVLIALHNMYEIASAVSRIRTLFGGGQHQE